MQQEQLYVRVELAQGYHVKRPSENPPRAVFLQFGNTFGNIRKANDSLETGGDARQGAHRQMELWPTRSLMHDTDQLFPADLMDAGATAAAVAGGDIAYLTVGLPIDSTLWEQRFPVMMANTIAACRERGTKLVFFDNTYMYPRTSAPQVEDTPFEPVGRKATVRARIASMLLNEMRSGSIEAVVCRAPEFYGPGKTKSLTNSAVFDRIKHNKRAMIPVNSHTRRILIWTPDASRGMGLIGNTPDAYGQTWHLPTDPERLTYAQMIDIALDVTGRDIRYTTVPESAFKVGGWFNPAVKEASELLPRYREDNVFESSKFATRFPYFQTLRNVPKRVQPGGNTLCLLRRVGHRGAREI